MPRRYLLIASLFLLAVLTAANGLADKKTRPDVQKDLDTVTLRDTLYFPSPEGDNVRVLPGTYRLSRQKGDLVQLQAAVGGLLMIQGTPMTHGEDVPGPLAWAPMSREPNQQHLVLIEPGGRGLEAAGRTTEIRARGLLMDTVDPGRVAGYTSGRLGRGQPETPPERPDIEAFRQVVIERIDREIEDANQAFEAERIREGRIKLRELENQRIYEPPKRRPGPIGNPYIEDVTPSRGGQHMEILIEGRDFTAYQRPAEDVEVFFKIRTGTTVKVDPEHVDVWNSKQVQVTVPEIEGIKSSYEGWIRLYVKQDGRIIKSNKKTFTVEPTIVCELLREPYNHWRNHWELGAPLKDEIVRESFHATIQHAYENDDPRYYFGGDGYDIFWSGQRLKNTWKVDTIHLQALEMPEWQASQGAYVRTSHPGTSNIETKIRWWWDRDPRYGNYIEYVVMFCIKGPKGVPYR